MITWILTGIVAGLALLVVLVAIVKDPVSRRQEPTGPDDPLDDAELRDPLFPTSFQGYSPEHVDAWTAEVARAVRVLTEEADPETLDRTRRRLAGLPPDEPQDGASEDVVSAEELEDGGGDRAGVLDR